MTGVLDAGAFRLRGVPVRTGADEPTSIDGLASHDQRPSAANRATAAGGLFPRRPSVPSAARHRIVPGDMRYGGRGSRSGKVASSANAD